MISDGRDCSASIQNNTTQHDDLFLSHMKRELNCNGCRTFDTGSIRNLPISFPQPVNNRGHLSPNMTDRGINSGQIGMLSPRTPRSFRIMGSKGGQSPLSRQRVSGLYTTFQPHPRTAPLLQSFDILIRTLMHNNVRMLYISSSHLAPCNDSSIRTSTASLEDSGSEVMSDTLGWSETETFLYSLINTIVVGSTKEYMAITPESMAPNIVNLNRMYTAALGPDYMSKAVSPSHEAFRLSATHAIHRRVLVCTGSHYRGNLFPYIMQHLTCITIGANLGHNTRDIDPKMRNHCGPAALSLLLDCMYCNVTRNIGNVSAPYESQSMGWILLTGIMETDTKADCGEQTPRPSVPPSSLFEVYEKITIDTRDKGIVQRYLPFVSTDAPELLGGIPSTLVSSIYDKGAQSLVLSFLPMMQMLYASSKMPSPESMCKLATYYLFTANAAKMCLLKLYQIPPRGSQPFMRSWVTMAVTRQFMSDTLGSWNPEKRGQKTLVKNEGDANDKSIIKQTYFCHLEGELELFMAVISPIISSRKIDLCKGTARYLGPTFISSSTIAGQLSPVTSDVSSLKRFSSSRLINASQSPKQGTDGVSFKAVVDTAPESTVPLSFTEHYNVDTALIIVMWGLEEIIKVHVLGCADYLPHHHYPNSLPVSLRKGTSNVTVSCASALVSSSAATNSQDSHIDPCKSLEKSSTITRFLNSDGLCTSQSQSSEVPVVERQHFDVEEGNTPQSLVESVELQPNCYNENGDKCDIELVHRADSNLIVDPEAESSSYFSSPYDGEDLNHISRTPTDNGNEIKEAVATIPTPQVDSNYISLVFSYRTPASSTSLYASVTLSTIVLCCSRTNSNSLGEAKRKQGNQTQMPNCTIPVMLHYLAGIRRMSSLSDTYGTDQSFYHMSEGFDALVNYCNQFTGFKSGSGHKQSCTDPLPFSIVKTLIQWLLLSFKANPIPVTAAALLHLCLTESAKEGVNDECLRNITMNASAFAISTRKSHMPGLGVPTQLSQQTSNQQEQSNVNSLIYFNEAIIIICSRAILNASQQFHQQQLGTTTSDGRFIGNRPEAVLASDILTPPQSWPLFAKLALCAVRIGVERNTYSHSNIHSNSNNVVVAAKGSTPAARKPSIDVVNRGMSSAAQRSLGQLFTTIARHYINDERRKRVLVAKRMSSTRSRDSYNSDSDEDDVSILVPRVPTAIECDTADCAPLPRLHPQHIGQSYVNRYRHRTCFSSATRIIIRAVGEVMHDFAGHGSHEVLRQMLLFAYRSGGGGGNSHIQCTGNYSSSVSASLRRSAAFKHNFYELIEEADGGMHVNGALMETLKAAVFAVNKNHTLTDEERAIWFKESGARFNNKEDDVIGPNSSTDTLDDPDIVKNVCTIGLSTDKTTTNSSTLDISINSKEQNLGNMLCSKSNHYYSTIAATPSVDPMIELSGRLPCTEGDIPIGCSNKTYVPVSMSDGLLLISQNKNRKLKTISENSEMTNRSNNCSEDDKDSETQEVEPQHPNHLLLGLTPQEVVWALGAVFEYLRKDWYLTHLGLRVATVGHLTVHFGALCPNL